MTRSILKFTLLIVSLISLVACAPRYPLGIPETQWQSMSTEQRFQAQTKQAELDRTAREARAADARAREAEAARQQAVLEVRRRDARYGERLQCILSEAEAHLGGRWRGVEPVAMDLVSGMQLAFDLTDSSSHTVHSRTPFYAAFDGQTISLCRDDRDEGRNPHACMRVLGTLADYRRGIDQRVDTARFLRGRIRCDLVPEQGMTRRHDYRK